MLISLLKFCTTIEFLDVVRLEQKKYNAQFPAFLLNKTKTNSRCSLPEYAKHRAKESRVPTKRARNAKNAISVNFKSRAPVASVPNQSR